MTVADQRLSTGIEGLDAVLDGGLIPRRSYTVTGQPGSGKTILGLHYLTAGLARGETALFVNLEETEADIRANAADLGFDLDGLEFLDLTPGSAAFESGGTYGIFAPDEVEGEDLQARIAERVREVDPDRVFVDPLTQFRALAADEYQFRKLVNGFTRFLAEHDATVVVTSQASDPAADEDLQFLSDGTIRLAHDAYGRTLTVPKFRGTGADRGPHSVRITDEGLAVFPALRPGEHGREREVEGVSTGVGSPDLVSGVPAIDELFGGGLSAGTVTVISGSSGVGKTTLGVQFLRAAARRGERSVLYSFEESPATLFERSDAIGIPLDEQVAAGTLVVESVEALKRSPAEFASAVRQEVEADDARVVMLDGIGGYRLSLQGADSDLERELAALCRYLTNMGVTVLLIDETDRVTGDFSPTESGISYLADNIVFLRYLEMAGELRKAIGVLKQRTSDFERTLREFEITGDGLVVGEPLEGLRGVLQGTPEFVEPMDPADGARSADGPASDAGTTPDAGSVPEDGTASERGTAPEEETAPDEETAPENGEASNQGTH